MTRSPFPGSPLSGTDLMTGLNTRFKQLYDATSFPLTSIGGTVNAVTATLDPALDGDGLLDGMMFTVTWSGTNTSGMTLALNGGSPAPVLSPDGSAMLAGSVESGLHSLLGYFGGDFVMLSAPLVGDSSGASRYAWTFTASSTWTKPDGVTDDTPVYVEGWGAGGGGNNFTSHGLGGGGGAYASRVIRAGDLSATVTVTVGAGGVGVSGAGTAGDGSNSTFGAVLTAYGGGGADGDTAGTGGGELQSGSSGGRLGGGEPYVVGSGGPDPVPDVIGTDATTIYGGGGGGGGLGPDGTGSSTGYWAVYGGGGGGSAVVSGGLSAYGGNGGGANTAGSAPGGGGGSQAAGARGEVRVWI